MSIDTIRCQGHGRCVIIAPDVFDVDDSGKPRTPGSSIPCCTRGIT
ncbi:MAG: ferredoxin [Trebonia sp.]